MANAEPQPPKPAPPRPSLCRVIAIILLILIILVGAAVLIIWLVVRPKRLDYTLEEGSIHGFNISNDRLDSTFDFLIRSYNPNTRVSIYYDRIDIVVKYDDQSLAYGSVPSFYQHHQSANRLDVHMKAQSVELFPSVAKDLKSDRTSGEVELSVVVKARIRYKVGMWKSKHRTIKILCYPVVNFSSYRTRVSTPCDEYV